MKKRGLSKKYVFLLFYSLLFLFFINYADALTCASGITCTLPNSTVTQCCRKANLIRLIDNFKLWDALEYNGPADCNVWENKKF